MWIVKTMDIIAEAVCEGSLFIGNVLLQYAILGVKGVVYIVLIATAAIWIIPYVLIKRVLKSRESTEG